MREFLHDDSVYLKSNKVDEIGGHTINSFNQLYKLSTEYMKKLLNIHHDILSNQHKINNNLVNMSVLSHNVHFSNVSDSLFTPYFQYNQHMNELFSNFIFKNFVSKYKSDKKFNNDLKWTTGKVMGVFLSLEQVINAINEADRYISDNL